MIDVALATLIGARSGLAADRTTPSTTVVNVKDEALPRLVYTRLPGSSRDYTDDGATGIRVGRYQIDVFAVTLSEALTTVDRLTKAATATPPGLDGYSGTVDTTAILWIGFPDDTRYEQTPVRDGQNRAIVRVSQDINISYRDAIG